MISWKSKKQSIVSLSSAEAEYRALAKATCELMWISYLLRDFGIAQRGSIPLLCDNKSAIHLTRNPVFHKRTKHIEMDCHFVRDKVMDGLVNTTHVSSRFQLADIFTKSLPTSTFNFLLSKLSVLNIYTPNSRGSVRSEDEGGMCNRGGQCNNTDTEVLAVIQNKPAAWSCGDDQDDLIVYKNLTAEGKTSLLLYHAVPVYYSLGQLRSNNGLMNSLATEGANKYDFTVKNDRGDVKLETKVVTATITGTLIDAAPMAVFKIDRVLLPRELFKYAPPEAPAPKSANSRSSRTKSAGDESDAPGPDSENLAAADADSDDGGRIRSGVFLSVGFSLLLGTLMCIF